MKKKIRNLIRTTLCLLLACTTLSCFAGCDNGKSPDAQGDKQEHMAQGTIDAVGGEMTWTVDVDGTLTIAGTGEMPDYSYTATPWFSFCPYITKVVVEEGVTRIGRFAFHLCEAMTSISLPESLRSIGDFAIRDCISLTSVTIPAGVTEIGEYFLIDDAALEKIEVAYGNPNYKVVNNCLIDADGVIIAAANHAVIPTTGVWKIGAYSFTRLNALTELTIPDNITEIGRWAFAETELTSIVIPDSVTVIAPYTFYKCYGLKSVVLPDTLTEIGEQAFSACDGLTSLTIPATVKTIGKAAFYGVTTLTDIYYGGTLADWDALGVNTDTWSVKAESMTIHCTDGDLKIKTYDDLNAESGS